MPESLRPVLGQPRLPVGPTAGQDPLRGYHIDLRVKAGQPEWRRPADPRLAHWVGVAQWGLGAFEHWVAGEGDRWLAAAAGAGDFLVETQVVEGRSRGAWPYGFPMPHTYRLPCPWVSAMAQAQGASLLVRLWLGTGREPYALAARSALAPLALPVGAGGVRAELPGGDLVFEEYPTIPHSGVLNGAIFALFGLFDVWRGLGDAAAGEDLGEGVRTLGRRIDLWDCGYWSRYDVYPHPLPNVASPFYHALHIAQLEALDRLVPSEPLAAARLRFIHYAARPACRARALAAKVAFRARVPRRGRRSAARRP
jgi:hypothetical protein